MTLQLRIHPPLVVHRTPGVQPPVGGAALVGEGEHRWRQGRQMFGKPSVDSGPGMGPDLTPSDDFEVPELGGLVDAYGTPFATKEARAPRPEAPKWCRQFYQPRGLSSKGVEIMKDLDPKGGGQTFPLGYENPNGSLADRLDYLARRYTAMDLVRKGQAFQVGGYYVHLSRSREGLALLTKWVKSMPSGGAPLEHEELMQWLALYRRPGLDQILALAPEAIGETWEQLEKLTRDRWIEVAQVQLGEGKLETLCLTKKGWDKVRQTHPDAEGSGWGPRRPLPQNREFHEQVVGDAATYALHELGDFEAQPFSVLLDPALRRLYLGAPYIPDLRLDYFDRAGVESHYLMEVEGGGDDYRGRHHRAKLHSAGQFRVFGARLSASAKEGGVFVRR